jgi:class 3 adenylate cyclase
VIQDTRRVWREHVGLLNRQLNATRNFIASPMPAYQNLGPYGVELAANWRKQAEENREEVTRLQAEVDRFTAMSEAEIIAWASVKTGRG